MSDELEEIVLSPKTTVKVKVLNGFEAMQADKIAGVGGNPGAARAFSALREINGVPLSPPVTSTGDISRVAKTLTMREFDVLVIEYAKRFMLTEEQLAQIQGFPSPGS